MSNIINVSVLNGYIHNVFSAEELLHNVEVCGEISGYKIYGAHSYFKLKDNDAQIDCACFNYARTYIPKDGEVVIVKGSVDFYSKNGKITFIIQQVTPMGNGLLALQMQQLKEKLEKLGYFDSAKKKAIPQFAKSVCVITSAQGAVIRDIVSTIRQKNDLINICVRDVRVQGNDCANDIIKAIKQVDKMGFDVLILARGGGSLEDLMGFNSESLVYAIFDANTPIISAVGHETDYSLSDFVADARALTPTAAAQMIAYDTIAIKKNIDEKLLKCKNSLQNLIIHKNLQLKLAQKQIASSFDTLYQKNIAKINQLNHKIYSSLQTNIKTKQHDLETFILRIDASSPMKILSKGYWQIFKDKNIVKSSKDLLKDDIVTLQSNDGCVKAKIE